MNGHPYILGVDPGPKQSGWVLTQREQSEHSELAVPVEHGVTDNYKLLADGIPGLAYLYGPRCIMVMEFTESRGQGFFGKEAMRTLWWAGRFRQAWGVIHDYVEVYPREVKRVLCGSLAQNDAGIRRAVIDRYPATGGGKEPAIGVKKQPGPLYGIAKDVWRALAVAIVWAEDPDYVLASQKAKGLEEQ